MLKLYRKRCVCCYVQRTGPTCHLHFFFLFFFLGFFGASAALFSSLSFSLTTYFYSSFCSTFFSSFFSTFFSSFCSTFFSSFTSGFFSAFGFSLFSYFAPTEGQESLTSWLNCDTRRYQLNAAGSISGLGGLSRLLNASRSADVGY